MTEQRFTLESVSAGLTINSQACATDEFQLRFAGGGSGRGSAPQGETRSRYEITGGAADAQSVLDALTASGLLGREFSQTEFDQYLLDNAAHFGPAAVFSLSSAFFEAALHSSSDWGRPKQALSPRFCLNILNGGRHAYTNPVLSDFHEYLLVPEHADIGLLLEDHRSIQEEVKSQLSAKASVSVAGNPVHVMGGQGNRGCIEFLLGILDGLGLSRRYGLMIDAAATQLWDGSAYSLDLAEEKRFSPDEFEDYWADIIADYAVAWMEDPFADHDLEHWSALVGRTATCRIAGDDVHCGDPRRVQKLLESGCITGVVLKPDQAGTISATLRAADIARAGEVPVVLSHRSISTDSPVLAHLMVHCGIELAKFGPLLSDFSSILKMNEVMRLTRDRHPVSPAVGTVGSAAKDAHAGA